MNTQLVSIWPFFTAFSSFLIMMGFMISFQWKIPVGGLFTACLGVAGTIISLTGWVSEIFESDSEERISTTAMVVFILSEIALFSGVLSAYLYNMLPKGEWISPGIPADIPPLGFAMILTVILISSSITIQMAERKYMKQWLSLTITLGLLFLIGQAREWSRLISEGFTISSNSYGTYFYLITGLHGSHVLVGVLFQLYILLLSIRKGAGGIRRSVVRICGYYWHFVDGLWLLILSLVYILPYSFLKS